METLPSTSTIIRNLRKTNALTQADIADFLHIDRSTYAYYESGRTKISIDVLLRLAEYFRVDILYLLGRTDDAQPEQQIASDDLEHLTQQERRLIFLFRTASLTQRKEVLHFAEINSGIRESIGKNEK
jgi:transcriptional regulator with XRE-family HTH domain